MGAGEIAAAVGLKQVTTGHTLCDESHAILLEWYTVPEPVIGLAVRPRRRPTRTDSRGPCAALEGTRRSACAPTTRPARSSSPAWASCTCSRSSSTASCASSASRRTWASRRSPTARRCARRSRRSRASSSPTGGRGQYGDAVISLKPNPGKGYEFDDQDHRWRDPEGVHQVGRRGHPRGDGVGHGWLAGYPVVDVKATLTFGSYHDVDSSEIAFKVAGSRSRRPCPGPIRRCSARSSRWRSRRERHGRRHRRPLLRVAGGS